MPGIGCNSDKPEIKRVFTFIIMIDFRIGADYIGNCLELLFRYSHRHQGTDT